MTIEELEEKARQLSNLRRKESIANHYREMLAYINKNADYFTVRGFGYSCRGDEKGFEFSSNYPFPAKYLRDGLAEVLGNLEHEIETLKAEIQR